MRIIWKSQKFIVTLSYVLSHCKLVDMPKIFEYFGLIFLFYSNEHEPIHVHVMRDGKEFVQRKLLKSYEPKN